MEEMTPWHEIEASLMTLIEKRTTSCAAGEIIRRVLPKTTGRTAADIEETLFSLQLSGRIRYDGSHVSAL